MTRHSASRGLAGAVSLVLALAGVAPAQVQEGTIALVSLDPNQFSLVDPTTAGVTPFALVNTTGAGNTNTNAILWDPASPQSFILGGEGFIGRVTITGPGTSTYALITNLIGIVSQMSWDANGQIIAIDSTSDQVVRVDPGTGAITPITTGVQPWGAEANCGAIDPVNGDIYVGAKQSMYKIPNGSTTPVLLSSGWTTGNGGFATGVAFHPTTNELVVSILTLDRIVKMDKTTGAMTDVCPPHAIQSCNALDFAPTGDLVVPGWTNNVYAVPFAGGSPQLITNVPGQGILPTGVAVVQSLCSGSADPYGAGCAGSGGFVPSLAVEGCPEPTSTITIKIAQGLGGSTALIFLGAAPAAIPLGALAGCQLLTFPLFGSPIAVPLGGTPGAPGAGALDAPAFIPAFVTGVTFDMQVLIVDPGSLLGATATNAVEISIP